MEQMGRNKELLPFSAKTSGIFVGVPGTGLFGGFFGQRSVGRLLNQCMPEEVFNFRLYVGKANEARRFERGQVGSEGHRGKYRPGSRWKQSREVALAVLLSVYRKRTILGTVI